MLNYMICASTLSHLRTLCSPIGQKGTQVKPKLAHNTQWVKICSFPTLLGQACGLVKNLALIVNVTLGSLVFPINELLEYEPIVEAKDFINAAIGVSRDIHSKELCIYTDFGRCCRPLLIVQNQRLLKKKKDIDAFYDKELVNAKLRPEEATSNAYTHYKIHPSLILGAYASIIPFPDNNQVRHAYDISLVKYVYILTQSHQFFFSFS
ncbi:DNA-directed RNA polymerase II subunit 2-like isoform X1 [Citrus sinensis]|uniref:DNA-directed RNA polymerase II subunit 2-like isoform X1 n=1 Tax=Citrus sinensis TaxID=2711 RepID=UPI002279546D|nr:DNA-directed RNA polymerase II subunit 2-like isoform X1 [Citrus sinensis]